MDRFYNWYSGLILGLTIGIPLGIEIAYRMLCGKWLVP